MWGRLCKSAAIETAFDETIDRSRQSGRRTRPARSRRDLVQREGAVTSRPGPCVRTIGGPRTHARVASRQSRDYRACCARGLRPTPRPRPLGASRRSRVEHKKARLRSSAKLSTRIAHRPCVSLLAPDSSPHPTVDSALLSLNASHTPRGFKSYLKLRREFLPLGKESASREWSHSRGEVRGASLAERRAAAPRARQPRSE